MRASSLFLVALLGACVGTDPESTENLQVEAPTLLADDPSSVPRARVVFDSDGPDTHAVSDEPFSHTSRKWHVYSLTAYPGAQIGVSLRSNDPRMNGRAEVRLYGPARADGSWPGARVARTDASGVATLAAAGL